MASRISRRLTSLVLVAGGALLVAGCSASVTGGPAPNITFSAPGIEGEGGSGATLPEEWPSDVPIPDGMTLESAVKFETPEGKSMVASFQGPGDANEVARQMTDQLKSAGFKMESSFSGSDATGVSLWSKGNVKVSLTVAGGSGTVTVGETVLLET